MIRNDEIVNGRTQGRIKLEDLDFGGQMSKVKISVTSHLLHPCERDISGTLWDHFFKFLYKYGPRIKWLDFGGQRSRSLWPIKQFPRIIIKNKNNPGMYMLSLTKFYTNWLADCILFVAGLHMCVRCLEMELLYSNIHIWSIVVQHKLFDFVDFLLILGFRWFHHTHNIMGSCFVRLSCTRLVVDLGTYLLYSNSGLNNHPRAASNSKSHYLTTMQPAP